MVPFTLLVLGSLRQPDPIIKMVTGLRSLRGVGLKEGLAAVGFRDEGGSSRMRLKLRLRASGLGDEGFRV